LLVSADRPDGDELEESGAIGFIAKQDLSPTQLRRIWAAHR